MRLMRLLPIWSAFICFLFLFHANIQTAIAQFTTLGAGGSTGGAAPPAYTGPGDIASGAIGFWSCGRAYNATYATGLNAACDVVDTATGLVTCTLHFLSTGFVNTTECNATACATACNVTKMYDQTGTGNHVVQATLANMPALTFNAQNGLPCAAGTNNAATRLATAGSVSQAAPYSMTAVAERTGSTTTLQRILNNNNNAAVLNFAVSANTVQAGTSTSVSLTANDNAFHALLAVVSGTAPLFAVDSSANISTSTLGTTAMSSTQNVAGRATGTQGLLAGFVCEAGIWPSDLNSVYQSMLSNMRSATNGWNF